VDTLGFDMKRILTNLAAAVGVVLAGLICLQIDKILPFGLPPVPQAVEWILLITGFCFIVLAEAAFLRRGGATGAPSDPTKHLVVAGIYKWMRNPIYLGGALVLLGVSLARQSPTLLLVAVLFLPVMHFTVVRGEERRLERDFGAEYLEYKRSVACWIPRSPDMINRDRKT
jgi:protein-S-isoprenylcysteine O-methyltransferase Ste14